MDKQLEELLVLRGKGIRYTSELRDRYKCLVGKYKQYKMSDLLHFAMYYSSLLLFDCLLGDQNYYSPEQRIAITESLHKML